MGKRATVERTPRGTAARTALAGPARRGGRAGRVLVGTASWADPGFVADWYPVGLPATERLAWYAKHFNLVEVNSSFYSVPPPTWTARWSDQTPDDFVFDVKLHRLLSRHRAPLDSLPRELRSLGGGNPEKATLTPKLEAAMVAAVREAVEPLVAAGKLGALLLQLTPSFGPNGHTLDELDQLLELLAGYRVAVELRNRGWVDGEQRAETVAYFQRHRVALVGIDGPSGNHFTIMPAMDEVTTPRLAYLRAHGRNARGFVAGRSVADRFDYDYSDRELEQIAARAIALMGLVRETHVIFNNNKSSYAPSAAGRFRRILAAHAARG